MKLTARVITQDGVTNIIEFVQAIIADACDLNSSDIHIDPKETYVLVRIRKDGMLEELCRYPHTFHAEVIARLKVLSRLRIDEHFIPQDGRIQKGESQKHDVRIVITPSYFGEAAVLRILRSYEHDTTLTSLGFSEVDESWLIKKINSGSGLFIVAGPTGSGKTTTLYALVSHILTDMSSVITIEDPIEYVLADARQISVNNSIGFRFPEGLRSILRQDPDVIVVGEIRDRETAQIAISAALTGHRVFATIHTSSAAEVVTRFVDMGVERYMIEATLKLVIAQRLLRKVCLSCSQVLPITEVERNFLKEYQSTELCLFSRHAQGCDECSKRGYKGRTVVYEMLRGKEMATSIVTSAIEKASVGEIVLSDVMSLICE